jgi:hypothetical protein
MQYVKIYRLRLFRILLQDGNAVGGSFRAADMVKHMPANQVAIQPQASSMTPR